MAMNLNYIIRNMKETDFEEVRQLWRLAEFYVFAKINFVMFSTDPEGFFVAQDIDSGKLIGVCSGVNLTPDLAFIGQFTVHPDYRGSGIGSAIWSKVMKHIGTERNVSLTSDPDMYEKYRDRSGFVVIPEKRICYYEGNFDCSQLVKSIEGMSVVDLNEDNIEKVIQYDQSVCRMNRRNMFKGFLKTLGFVIKLVLNNDNQVLGFCVIGISTFDHYMIEPLYANDQNIAELLIYKCYQSLPDSNERQFLYHLYDDHSPSLAIVSKMGLKLTFKEPLLFTKRVVEGDKDKTFSFSATSFFPF